MENRKATSSDQELGNRYLGSSPNFARVDVTTRAMQRPSGYWIDRSTGSHILRRTLHLVYLFVIPMHSYWPRGLNEMRDVTEHSTRACPGLEYHCDRMQPAASAAAGCTMDKRVRERRGCRPNFHSGLLVKPRATRLRDVRPELLISSVTSASPLALSESANCQAWSRSV